MSVRDQAPWCSDAELIGNDSYGGRMNVDKMLFGMGCFNHSPCVHCSSPVRINIFVAKKSRSEREVQCITTTLRCKNKSCQKTHSPFAGTIWKEISDRQLFLFVIGAFLGRCTVRSVADLTSSKEETISKYTMIIKNALYLENEAEKADMKLGGAGVVVQGDESRVFSRKYNVGRVLKITEHGWLFGMVEDKENGRLYLEMVKTRDGERLKGIIKDHTQDGTTVFTDRWPAYEGLDDDQTKHFKVNHKQCFVSHQRINVEEGVEVVECGSDEAEDADDQVLLDDTIVVHTNKIERVWREVKRGLRDQPLRLLSRNVGVEMYRYNHLNANVPFAARRDIIINLVAKHQSKIQDLLRNQYPIYPEEQ